MACEAILVSTGVAMVVSMKASVKGRTEELAVRLAGIGWVHRLTSYEFQFAAEFSCSFRQWWHRRRG
jgi:hypothetical protein